MKKTAREELKNKKRIVIKIGSSSLTHPETGDVNLVKIERLIRVISDLRGMGKEVVLVSSGAIAAGRQALGCQKPQTVAEKQAYAAVGQARLMMVYQKIFSEYNQTAAQVLMTKNTIVDNTSRENARNTFDQLLKLGTVPVVKKTTRFPLMRSNSAIMTGFLPLFLPSSAQIFWSFFQISTAFIPMIRR